jgi:hypothetical protein
MYEQEVKMHIKEIKMQEKINKKKNRRTIKQAKLSPTR